ncbi:MAG: methionine--tRNA ligase [Candidatus Omnitrophica bacterium]|nr:methionine--tRNA ligase [Candidatus Omnitrophota bacterium]
MGKKRFYITSPLYYVNADPHIGHAYTEIACDCIARYERMKGKEVFFLTGTDEHGQKILRSAEDNGKAPIDFVDSVVPKFKDLWKGLSISYDDFIRTTEKRHVDTVQKVLATLYKKGDIYQDEYKGFYCTPCETFWPKMQLEDGLCPDCKHKVEEISETNYFFKLSKYQDWLKNYIKETPGFISPGFRRNEVLGYLEEPLNDLCISRPNTRLSWGINIPFAQDHVTYVWFDALINYISGCGWGSDDKKFKECWPCDFHVIGKDILRPHAVYWPIMLHALGVELPKTIFAHGWWMMGGSKMSKSKGNVIDPFEIIEKYGQNAFRYFLLREVTFGLDGTFSEEVFITRFNGDLANDLGNLLNRTLTMVEKYFDGVVPEEGDMDEQDKALDDKLKGLPAKIDKFLPELNFNQSLISVWEVINIANKHIEVSKPWQLAKENKIERLKALMHILLKVLSYSALYIYPFMPGCSLEMIKQLGLDIKEKDITFDRLRSGLLKPGTKINKGSPIFPRIDSN